MNVVFFGSSSYVIPILEVLRKNFDLALVLTTEKNPADAVSTYCIKNKIPYLSVPTLSDLNLQSSIFNLQSSVAVLADFGLIIPTSVLNFLMRKSIMGQFWDRRKKRFWIPILPNLYIKSSLKKEQIYYSKF